MVVAEFATTAHPSATEGKTQTHLAEHYGLDMILSVGYRVKSKRGVEFRRWASDMLRRYAIDGNAANRQSNPIPQKQQDSNFGECKATR